MGGVYFNNAGCCGLLVLLFMVSISYGMKNEAIGCTHPAPTAVIPDVQRPTVPNTYETHIECIIRNKNQSTEIHEYFDFDGNRGHIRQRQNGFSLWAYYDYDSNELIEILNIKPRICSVTDLSKSNQRFLLGYDSSAQSGGHIFSSAGALRFSSNTIQETYVGTDVVRGIRTRKWYSCQYWNNMDATMDVYWHFSDPNSWDTAIGLPEIPIRAYVKGIAYNVTSGVPHNFEHIYDFIHYKNYIKHNEVFETPSMVVCPGRKNIKPFPVLPKYFSFTIEIIDTARNSVTFMTESYDTNTNVTKYEYKPSELTVSPYGYRPLTEIHDFNTGVAYIIDPMYGNCSTVPIELGNFDTKNIDAHRVRMRTAREFFSTDNTKVTYEGVKTVRNVPCDTWIGTRSTSQMGDKLNSTWEWYFKTDGWSTVEQTDETTVNGGTPIQMRLKVPDYGMNYLYNLYGFSKQQQNLVNFDISPCYINGNRKRFDFQIPAKYKATVDANRNVFKYSLMISLAGYMVVSPLRVSNIQISYQDAIHVRFELLDVAPDIGDIANRKKETSLDLATTILTKAINTNDFVILLYSEEQDKVIPVTAVTGSIVQFASGQSFKNRKPAASGYTGGSMAGLAIGMIVVGGGAGAALAFKLFK